MGERVREGGKGRWLSFTANLPEESSKICEFSHQSWSEQMRIFLGVARGVEGGERVGEEKQEPLQMVFGVWGGREER